MPNPILKPEIIERVETFDGLDSSSATVTGTVGKLVFLTLIVLFTATYTWSLAMAGFADKVNLFMIVGIVGGLIAAIVTAFNRQISNITAPIYAIFEGLALGGISCHFEQMFKGVVINAVAATIVTLLAMLLLYQTKIIRPTEKFRSIVLSATFGIMLFYLITLIASWLGHPSLAFAGGPISIVISGVICLVAAFNFILDFDLIEQAEQNGMPKYFEWYGAFGVLVTLVWLYIELLRLLSYLNSRD